MLGAAQQKLFDDIQSIVNKQGIPVENLIPVNPPGTICGVRDARIQGLIKEYESENGPKVLNIRISVVQTDAKKQKLNPYNAFGPIEIYWDK